MVDTNERGDVPRGRIEIRTGVERRRRWSAQEKGRIVAQAIAPGAVIAAVARRHDLTPQHLSNWVRAAKDGHFALPAEAAPGSQSGASFVPVVMHAPSAAEAATPRAAGQAPIEITMGKITVRVRAGADARLLEAVLAALKRAAS